MATALTLRCVDFSNGSGKSSLAMATLWALTGSLDSRPMQDAKVADVVNDDAKVRTLWSFEQRLANEFLILRSVCCTVGSSVGSRVNQ
jgi:hypothetical protein